MKWTAGLLALIALLLVSSVALAMSSANFRLDWFTPLTGAGGAALSSTNYTMNFTIGQSVIGASSSANYKSSLGYWVYQAAVIYYLYLPVVFR